MRGMPELSTDAMKLLRATVKAHETHGFPHPVGSYDDESHEHARALVRAGMAEWFPPLQPISRFIARRAGRSPFIADTIRSRSKIVPTDLGRVEAKRRRRRAA
jgi:hypothetical protein